MIRHRLGALLATTLLLGALGALGCGARSAPLRVEVPRVVDSKVIGRLRSHEIARGDNFVELARAYGVGYVELVAANPGVDPWVPAAGKRLLIPDAHVFPDDGREGLLINVAEQRLYYFAPEGPRTFAIGVARDGWETPLGSTEVVEKKEGPTWYPGTTARRDDPSLGESVPPGPDNPLGTHALYLGWPLYLIHGTNEPFGIGRLVSRGCVRLYPEDILRLYPQVEVGTPVRVVSETLKAAVVRGVVVLEAHPTLAQAAQIEEAGRFDPVPMPASLRPRLLELVGGDASRIDWERVRSVAERRRGVPIRVSRAPAAKRPAPR